MALASKATAVPVNKRPFPPSPSFVLRTFFDGPFKDKGAPISGPDDDPISSLGRGHPEEEDLHHLGPRTGLNLSGQIGEKISNINFYLLKAKYQGISKKYGASKVSLEPCKLFVSP